MPVPEGRMPMQVGVSGTSRLRDLVSLLVMLVMFVHVFVLQWLVPMGVRMVLGKMEPHASCHQSARQQQRQGHRVAEQHSRRRPEERSDGETRADVGNCLVSRRYRRSLASGRDIKWPRRPKVTARCTTQGKEYANTLSYAEQP